MTEAAEALRLFFSMESRVECQAGGVTVLCDRAEIRAARKLGGAREFLRLPSTGGAFVLASLGSSRAFTMGLDGLTLSRPMWLLGRRVLAALSRVGLHRCLGLQRLAVRVAEDSEARGLEYSLQMGVPGGGQKLIVREWGAAEGEAYWKLGVRGLPAQLVEDETRALRWLASKEGCGALAPTLLNAGSNDEVSWLKMQALEGERPAGQLDAAALGFLKTLAGSAGVKQELQASEWYLKLARRLQDIEAGAPELSARCRAALDALCKQPLGSKILFQPAHGDFTPWNTKLCGGQLRAFDWEFFEPAAPALFDWHHWILQSGVLVRHSSADELFAQLCVPVELAAEDSPAQRSCLLQLYLIDVLSREEAIMQHGRPEFKQAQWLRDMRLELLGRCKP